VATWRGSLAVWQRLAHMVAGDNRARRRPCPAAPTGAAIRLAALRPDAVQRCAGAHQVEMVIGRQRCPEELARLARYCGKRARMAVKGQLLAVHQVGALVGAARWLMM
jgi:hypothetical protein